MSLLWLEALHIIFLSIFYVTCAFFLTKIRWKWSIGKSLSSESHWTQKARILFTARMDASSLVIIFPVTIVIISLLPRFSSHEVTPKTLKLLWFCTISLFVCITVSAKILRRYHTTPPMSTVKSMCSSLFLLYPNLTVALIFIAISPFVSKSFLWLWLISFAAVTWLALTKWSLPLAKWCGVLTPAPQLQTMIPDNSIATYFFYHKTASAFALIFSNAICVSEKLYGLLDDKQMRSIMAHEYQHHQKHNKIARAFICSPAFILVGGYKIFSLHNIKLYWIIPLIFLLATIKNAAMKIFLREEKEIDDFVSKAMDNKAYAQALEAMYKENLVPAVMAKNTTHPHLYDRMLDAGVTPDFPRPQPPEKSKKMIIFISIAVLTLTTPQITSIFLNRGLHATYARILSNGLRTNHIYHLSSIHYRNKDYQKSAQLYATISKEKSNYGDFSLVLATCSYAYANDKDMTRIYWEKTQKRRENSQVLKHQDEWLQLVEEQVQRLLKD